jgi:RHS repeat-associated protein
MLMLATAGLVVTGSAAAALPADRVSSGFVEPLVGDPVAVMAVPRPRVDGVDGHDRFRWQPEEVIWPQPSVTAVDVAGVGAAVVGEPAVVSVAAADGRGSVGRVVVEVVDRQRSAQLGISGLLFAVRPTVSGAHAGGVVEVSVDYGQIAGAYGGGWASRLRLVQVPGCALASPQVAACHVMTPMDSVNDTDSRTVSAQVVLPPADTSAGVGLAGDGDVVVDSGGSESGGVLLALVASAGSEAGDWSATDLQSAGSWAHGGSSGGFSYSYGMRTPPAAGPVPGVGLSYSSQAHDGLTSGSNNQASWIGDGWSYSPGFVERTYKVCASDQDGGNNSEKTGDLCWDGDSPQVTLSLNGTNTSLVKDDTSGAWHAASDSGWRIQKLGSPASPSAATSERWVVTTTDGTRWFFAGEAAGSSSRWTVPVFGNHVGEPCRVSQFANSQCRQAYRWMLDKVVDVHGNMTRYFYTTETGHYGAGGDVDNRLAYHRSGRLVRIDYGLRESNPSGDPAGQVTFTSADRCLDDCWVGSQPKVQNWPDTPWDRTCAAAPCTEQTAPAFFTSKRLATVSTSADGATVDSWQLVHEFLDYGDESQVVMWLKSVQHTGHVGGVQASPAMTFTGQELPNRVDHNGVPAIWRWRMQSITSETGGLTTVHYAVPDCGAGDLPASAHSNTRRCFPAFWTPEHVWEPEMDWFHKHVVEAVVVTDTTGGGGEVPTFYDYATSGGGTGVLWGWDDGEFTDDEHRTYNQWRGYPQVTTTVGAAFEGDQIVSRSRYYRGMHGQPLPGGGTRSVSVTSIEGTSLTDHEALAGQVLETVSLLDGVVESGTVYRYWRQQTAARVHDGGTAKAWMSAVERSESRQRLAGSTWHRTRVDTSFDTRGRPVTVDDRGDITIAADRRCTRTDYADNTSLWIFTAVARAETVAVACSATPDRPDDVISDARVFYDGSPTWGAPPTRGLATATEVLDDWDNGPVYAATGELTYDALGRPTSTTDAVGNTSTMAYTPTGAGAVTQTVATNPLGHTTTTTLEPAWGAPVAIIDPNSRRTDLTYDPLGRVTAVWTPGLVKDTDLPYLAYEYAVHDDAPSVVTTHRINAHRQHLTSTTLLDSLLRHVQTQAPTPQGGRLLTETVYNTRGLVEYSSGPNWDDTTEPDDTYVSVPQGADHARAWYTYDSLGRVTVEEFWSKNVKLWQSSTMFGGSTDGYLVRATPPQGGTAVGVLTDAHGRLVERRDYEGSTPVGSYIASSYAYDRKGRATETADAAGNAWTYEYDLRGRKISRSDPDSGTSTISYDDLGRVVSVTDARGQSVSTVYDELSRVVERWFGEVDTGTLVNTWTFDTMSGGLGLPALASTFVDGYEIRSQVGNYDAAGNATRSRVSVPSMPGLEAFARNYDVTTLFTIDGQVTSTVLPATFGMSREAVVNVFNDFGLPSRMLGDLSSLGHVQTYVDSSTYTAYGELAQRTLGGGSQVYHTYNYDDGTRRLLDFRLSRDAVGATNVAHLHYDYDPAGNILSIADTVEDAPGVPERQCFRYDQLRRLVDAWAQAGDDPCAGQPSAQVLGGPAPYWSQYTFDVAGNRLSQTRTESGGAATTSSYTYPGHGNPQPHTLSSVTTGAQTDTYTYDAAGNLIERTVDSTTQTIDWAPDGRIEQITEGSDTTRMIYHDGIRLARINPNGDATVWVAGQEITRTAATGDMNVVRSYEHLGQVVTVRTSNTHLQWIGADHHHTATFAIDNTTMAVTYRRLDPYGNPRGSQQTWPAGQEHFVRGINDDTVGLIHIGARSYDPTTGRFISADPITNHTDSQQIHGYSYANNNPIGMSDPTGLYPGPTLCLDQCGSEVDKWFQNRLREEERQRRQDGGGSGGGSQGCGAQLLNCSIEEIEAMSIAERTDLVEEWMVLHAAEFNAKDDLAPVQGVLQFMLEIGIGDGGSWSSWVDATILHAVQDGLAIAHGIVGSSSNPAGELWAEFFTYKLTPEREYNEHEARRRWGVAEEAATRHGYQVAAAAGVENTVAEALFAVGGHTFRHYMRHHGDWQLRSSCSVWFAVCGGRLDTAFDTQNAALAYHGGHYMYGAGTYITGIREFDVGMAVSGAWRANQAAPRFGLSLVGLRRCGGGAC